MKKIVRVIVCHTEKEPKVVDIPSTRADFIRAIGHERDFNTSTLVIDNTPPGVSYRMCYIIERLTRTIKKGVFGMRGNILIYKSIKISGEISSLNCADIKVIFDGIEKYKREHPDVA